MKIMAATICFRFECTLVNISVIINSANKNDYLVMCHVFLPLELFKVLFCKKDILKKQLQGAKKLDTQLS